MKSPLSISKALSGIMAVGLASLVFTSVSHASYLYWDPYATTVGSNYGNGGTGTATWDMSTANWFNGDTSGLTTPPTDVAFSTFGSNDHLVIGGYAGEMDIASGGVTFNNAGASSGPAILPSSSWGGGTYTIGAAGATNPIIFNTAAQNNEFVEAYYSTSVPTAVIFNAPIQINLTSSTQVYGSVFAMDSAYTMTFANGISVTGAQDAATMGITLRAATGGTIILDGASVNSGSTDLPPSITCGAGGNSGPGGLYVLPATASFTGGYSFQVQSGTMLVSTSNLGTSSYINVNTNGAGTSSSFLTGGAVTIGLDVRAFTTDGTHIIGGATADHSIYTGQIGSWSSSAITLTAATGGQVDFDGNIGWGGGTITKAGAGTVVFGYDAGNTYGGSTEIQSGTLLTKNTGGSAFGNDSTKVVALDSGATLGGTGISSQQIVAGGVSAIVAPGDSNSTGTLHLNGGMVATSGVTLNLDINGAANDVIDFGTAPLTLGGSVIVNFNSLSSVDIGSVYTLFTGSGDWSASSPSFSLNAPAGYTLDLSYGGGQGYSFNTSTHDFSVQFGSVPEPSSYMMIIAGFALLAFVSRMTKATGFRG